MSLVSSQFLMKNDGTIWACGRNYLGSLGIASSALHAATFTYVDISDVADVNCNESSTVIIKNDGSLWFSGTNNSNFGNGNITNTEDFVKSDIDSVTSVFSSNGTSFVIKKDGSVWACGYNNYGQLGLGDVATHCKTFTRTNLTDVKYICCNSNFTVALKNDGSVWVCGYNNYGQLGLGDVSYIESFTKIDVDDVKEIYTNDYNSILLKKDGTLFVAGQNEDGMLGVGSTSQVNTFTKVDIDNVENVYCQNNTNLVVIKKDGTLWGTGRNGYGQLGTGNKLTTYYFTRMDIDDIKHVDYGTSFFTVLKNDGTVWSCGYNYHGQLGDGTTVNKSNFVNTGLDNVKQIFCGDIHTIALKKDGSLWTCGSNNYGQLGDSTVATSRSNFQKVDIDNVYSIMLDNDSNYLKKYIIKSDDKYFTISNGVLSKVAQTICEDVIDSIGITIELINENLSILPDKFSLISSSYFNMKIKALHSSIQMMVASNDFSTIVCDNIDYFKSYTEKSDTLSMKVAFSLDSGLTWKTHNGQSIIDLSINIPLKEYSTMSNQELEQWNIAKQEIAENGIDSDNLELVDFNVLGSFEKIRFAYVLSIDSFNDKMINKSLSWQFDSKGSLQLLKDTEHDIYLSKRGVKLSSLIDTEMVKLELISSNITE